MQDSITNNFLSVLGLETYNQPNFPVLSSSQEWFDDVRLPNPLQVYGPAIEAVISMKILENPRVSKDFQMITYLNINWEKDHSLLNTHLYYQNLDHKFRFTQIFEESGKDYYNEIYLPILQPVYSKIILSKSLDTASSTPQTIDMLYEHPFIMSPPFYPQKVSNFNIHFSAYLLNHTK